MSRITLADRAAAATERVRGAIDERSNVLNKARALVAGDAQFFAAIPKPEQIRAQLADDSISEKKEGMKRIIAGMCKGTDMSALFPDVVKNILVNSIELRKLVYYYIVHYAEDRPNEALLSISAFQKDLVDPSMHVRSLALRMISSIRIPTIHPVVMIAIRKCSTDMAPIVRKTAAISLSQACAVSGGEESQEIILQLIHQFLGDRSPEVIGAAGLSYLEICPNQVELIHKHYRKLCRSLVEMDEWGQVIMLHILLRYARTQFVDPNCPPSSKRAAPAAGEDADSDVTTPESSDTESEQSEGLAGFKLHSDHRLLLQCVKPLLLSMNRAVVIGAVSLLYHVAPHDELDQCVKPLLRLLSGPPEGHMIVLSCIHTIILLRPELFVPYVKEFFLNPDDADNTRQLKIRIIASLTRPGNFVAVSHEFRSYLRSFDVKKVVATVHGLGLISTGTQSKEHANSILQLIAPLLSHKSGDVVTECVVVLRQLVVQGSDQNHTVKIVHKLLVQLMRGEIKAAAARASIVWLVGENIGMHVAIAKSAPDCFRTLAKNFASEDPQVKKQALTLGCKLWFHLEGAGELAERFKQIFFYVLELVKYDNDYELRDRGRIIECALDRQSKEFAALKEAMLAQKPLPRQRDPYVETAKYQMGSLSHLCGTALLGYQELPVWPDEAPVCEAREPPSSPKDSPMASDHNSSSSEMEDSDDDDDEDDDDETSSSSSSSEDSDDSSSASSSSASSSGQPTTTVQAAAKPAIVARKIITRVVQPGGAAAAAAATEPSKPPAPAEEPEHSGVEEKQEQDEAEEQDPADGEHEELGSDHNSDNDNDDKKEDAEAEENNEEQEEKQE